jgi:hypothetical protein
MAEASPLGQVVDGLKRLRVRQGENHVALALLVQHAERLICGDSHLAQTATDIKNRALELRRAGAGVPRFVVEDLLEDSIARLERARPGS